MSRKAYPGIGFYVIGVVSALAVVACHPGAGPATTAARPECPRDSLVYIPRDTSFYLSGTVAASGPISTVPEYHDCQRFVTERGDSFGSLIAIFASSGLDSVADPPPGPYSPTNVLITGRDGKAAATILNYDDEYEPLRIDHGINCLYMTTTNGVWRATIIRVESDSVCLRPASSAQGGSPLAVSVVPRPVGKIPPVARWDWDPEARQHYIGIRCGSQWCEVYNPSLQVHHASASYDGTEQMRVKGWYDEQNLAVSVPSAAQGPGLVPGGVQGTIVPIGDLSLNTENDFDRTWKPVALVSLAAPSQAYKDKFNFIPGPPPVGNSQVALCMGSRETCQIPATENIDACANQDDTWWARITSGPVSRYRCVIRRQHPGVQIPGAVRWRW
ncbi:MAG TPA: hypothetical protein VF187_06730, partial [Gemmatimonadales bacterium]